MRLSLQLHKLRTVAPHPVDSTGQRQQPPFLPVTIFTFSVLHLLSQALLHFSVFPTSSSHICLFVHCSGACLPAPGQRSGVFRLAGATLPRNFKLNNSLASQHNLGHSKNSMCVRHTNISTYHPLCGHFVSNHFLSGFLYYFLLFFFPNIATF